MLKQELQATLCTGFIKSVLVPSVPVLQNFIASIYSIWEKYFSNFDIASK
jgi:hypothetical protein